MSKQIFIYFLTIILITSVIVPTYITLSEKKCESSIVNDTDSDENLEEYKIKLYCSNDIIASYQVVVSQREVLHLTKSYASISKTLESPPPEFLI